MVRCCLLADVPEACERDVWYVCVYEMRCGMCETAPLSMLAGQVDWSIRMFPLEVGNYCIIMVFGVSKPHRRAQPGMQPARSFVAAMWPGHLARLLYLLRVVHACVDAYSAPPVTHTPAHCLHCCCRKPARARDRPKAPPPPANGLKTGPTASRRRPSPRPKHAAPQHTPPQPTAAAASPLTEGQVFEDVTPDEILRLRVERAAALAAQEELMLQVRRPVCGCAVVCVSVDLAVATSVQLRFTWAAVD